jgi:hypothetical protein
MISLLNKRTCQSNIIIIIGEILLDFICDPFAYNISTTTTTTTTTTINNNNNNNNNTNIKNNNNNQNKKK